MHSAEMVFAAEDGDEIAGVLQGRKEQPANLFARGYRRREGLGCKLVGRLEGEGSSSNPRKRSLEGG